MTYLRFDELGVLKTDDGKFMRNEYEIEQEKR